jgi:hypothetical protein
MKENIETNKCTFGRTDLAKDEYENKSYQNLEDFKNIESELYNIKITKNIVGERASETINKQPGTYYTIDLSDLDIELLAMGMKLSWLDQTLNSTELTLQFIGGKEEKFFSQANQLAELRALRADTLREMQQLYTYSTYANNSYFD